MRDPVIFILIGGLYILFAMLFWVDVSQQSVFAAQLRWAEGVTNLLEEMNR